MVCKEGAAKATGSRLKAPKRYLAKVAALSDVPRAAIRTKYTSRARTSSAIAQTFGYSASINRRSTSGCSRISLRSCCTSALLSHLPVLRCGQPQINRGDRIITHLSALGGKPTHHWPSGQMHNQRRTPISPVRKASRPQQRSSPARPRISPQTPVQAFASISSSGHHGSDASFK